MSSPDETKPTPSRPISISVAYICLVHTPLVGDLVFGQVPAPGLAAGVWWQAAGHRRFTISPRPCTQPTGKHRDSFLGGYRFGLPSSWAKCPEIGRGTRHSGSWRAPCLKYNLLFCLCSRELAWVYCTGRFYMSAVSVRAATRPCVPAGTIYLQPLGSSRYCCRHHATDFSFTSFTSRQNARSERIAERKGER